MSSLPINGEFLDFDLRSDSLTFHVCGTGDCRAALSHISFIIPDTRNSPRIAILNPNNGDLYQGSKVAYRVVIPISNKQYGIKYEVISGEGIKNNNECDDFTFTLAGDRRNTTITVETKAGTKALSIPFDPASCVCQNNQSITTRVVQPETDSKPEVTAYPNPYNDQVRFNILSPVSGRAVLEAHDLLGRRIGIIYQGSVQAGVVRTVEYRIPATHRVAMIYTLRVGGKVINGKLFPTGGIHY